jgi:hypothetical protein
VISAYPGSDDEMICIANSPVQDRPAETVEEEASVVGTSEAVGRRGVFRGNLDARRIVVSLAKSEGGLIR